MEKWLSSNKKVKSIIPRGKVAGWFADNDRDGVPNVFDCQPNNPKKQGWVEGVGWRATPKEAREAYRKLRDANVPTFIASQIRGWRPTRIKDVIEGKRYTFQIEQEKKRIEETGEKTPPWIKKQQNAYFQRSGPRAKKIARGKKYVSDPKVYAEVHARHLRWAQSKRDLAKAEELIEKKGPQLESIDLNDEGQGPDIV